MKIEPYLDVGLDEDEGGDDENVFKVPMAPGNIHREGRYYRYRLDIMRLAGPILSINVDFSQPLVSASVLNFFIHGSEYQSQYQNSWIPGLSLDINIENSAPKVSVLDLNIWYGIGLLYTRLITDVAHVC